MDQPDLDPPGRRRARATGNDTRHAEGDATGPRKLRRVELAAWAAGSADGAEHSQPGTLEHFLRLLPTLDDDDLLDPASPDSPWPSLAATLGLSLTPTLQGVQPQAALTQPQQRRGRTPTADPAGPEAACRNSLIRRGYCRLPPAEALWDAAGAAEHARLVQALARAVSRAADLGWPLALLLVFDEPWRTARMYGRFVRRLSYGKLELSPDFVFFNVRPGSRGWGPHRDRPTMPFLPLPNSAPAAATMQSQSPPPPPSAPTLDRRLPAYVTLWLALTPATPDNGCIYVVPADLDPLHDKPLSAGSASADSLHPDRSPTSLPDTESGLEPGAREGGPAPPTPVDDLAVPDLQAIRALPAAAGEALLWSGRLLHWGGAADAEAPGPRLALSLAACAPCFEDPTLRGADLRGGGEGEEDDEEEGLEGRHEGRSVSEVGGQDGCGAESGAGKAGAGAGSGARGQRAELRGTGGGGAGPGCQLPSLRERLVVAAVQLRTHEHREPLGAGLWGLLERLEAALERAGGAGDEEAGGA